MSHIALNSKNCIVDIEERKVFLVYIVYVVYICVCCEYIVY